MVSVLVVVLPVLIAVIVVFAPAPESGKRIGLTWRVSIAAIGMLTAVLALKQQWNETEEKQRLSESIETLKKTGPLRKQAADLAKELLDFYADREHYNDHLKPGQALNEKEIKAALRWYKQTVQLYHERYEKRVVTTLDEIHSITGMQTDEEGHAVFAHVRFDAALKREFVAGLKKYLDYLETTLE